MNLGENFGIENKEISANKFAERQKFMERQETFSCRFFFWSISRPLFALLRLKLYNIKLKF